MNHLAHALLAGPDSGLILGGLMGDFVHGPIPPDLAPALAFGLRLHRAIDVHTDTHPVVREARGLFEPPFRRYAGILLDVWFDHLLARDFARWSDMPLREYSDGLLVLLDAHLAELPPPMRRFVAYMRERDVPYRYAERAMIGHVLTGVGMRLQRANPLAEALPVLERLAPALDAAFAEFFPALMEFAHAQRTSAGYA